MAGDQIPANTGDEVLVAQAPRSRSLSDEILKERPGTPPPAEKPIPPPPGDTRPATIPAERPRQSDAPAPPTGAPARATDRTDVVLKLSYKDAKFDENIWKTVNYNTIEITDFPPDARIQHWADKDGNFFYLTDKTGKMVDNKLHHYPGNLAKIIVNGAQQDVNAERRKVSEAIARKNDINILDGVLTVSLNDPNFDAKLFKVKSYDTLNITNLPPGAKITHGMDSKGFYFDVGDSKRHYYPTNAKQLAVDGTRNADLTKTRYESIDAYSKSNFGGFQDYVRDRDPLANAQQVLSFAMGMDRKGAASLDVLDKGLTEAIASSEHHPYFKYLLANVKLAQAMGAVRQRVLDGQPINHPSVIDKIDKCDELLDQVIKDSDSRLRTIGRGFPKGRDLMGLAPYAPYNPRDPNGHYLFWGGTWDQAGFMKPGVKFIKGLVQSNALGLPPERP